MVWIRSRASLCRVFVQSCFIRQVCGFKCRVLKSICCVQHLNSITLNGSRVFVQSCSRAVTPSLPRSLASSNPPPLRVKLTIAHSIKTIIDQKNAAFVSFRADNSTYCL
jgi:hypothetical protein